MRLSKIALRCPRCRMHDSLCVCALIPTLVTRTRILLVIHRNEDEKTTNTGRLATEALPNSEVVVRGHANDPRDRITWSAASRPLLLFPHRDAVPLADLAFVDGDDRDVTLIVPDGNWRQASKVRTRVAGMRDVPCVMLPPGESTRERLRTEFHPFGLPTLEAIARSLRILEGHAGPAIEGALLEVLRAQVERTLWSRGKKTAEERV